MLIDVWVWIIPSGEDSLRQATLITSDDATELILIEKADYMNLISVMKNEETLHKVSLLR
jgi:hypothetical protein